MVKKFSERMEGCLMTGSGGREYLREVAKRSVECVKKLVAERNNRRNVDGWSPVSRMLQIVLWGLVDLRNEVRRGGGDTKGVYRRWRRDELKVKLNQEEEEELDALGGNEWRAVET